MKKHLKLRLSRETLRQLQPEQVGRVRGGNTNPPFTNTQEPSFDPCDTQRDCTNICPASELCLPSGVC
jgi:hypothetical protein